MSFGRSWPDCFLGCRPPRHLQNGVLTGALRQYTAAAPLFLLVCIVILMSVITYCVMERRDKKETISSLNAMRLARLL
jgi:hypothetical protein